MAEIMLHTTPTTCKTNGVNGCSSGDTFSKSNNNRNHSASNNIGNHVTTMCMEKENASQTGRLATKGSHVNGSGSSLREQQQQALPKLPLPELQNTMSKYLSLIQTVVPPQDYARTKQIVTEFCKPQGLGSQLQDYLLKRQQTMDNWATDYWLNDMYLNIKLPLTINSSPGAVFPYQRFPSSSHQIRYAARFVHGMLDFKQLLDTQTLPVEKLRSREKGQPLCMEQHYRLFTCYREPGRERDCLRTDATSPGKEYIIVARHNQFFRMNVQRGNERISEANLCLQMSRILKMADEKGKSSQVGILTSQARNTWAEHRSHLLQDSTNRESLQLLENCLFLLCLDKTSVSPSGYRGDLVTDMTARAHHIIHGNGSECATGNRWMDKTLQVIVSEDGSCGVNFEHSAADGIAICYMIEHAFGVMSKTATNNNNSHDQENLEYPTRLEWNLSPQSLSHIQTAREVVDSCIDDFDLAVFKFDGYGSNFIKKQNMSPDAYIQLSLQLTYFKIHGKMSSTYESASIRRYRQGRVDVIRANSQPALTWIRAMLGQTDRTEEDKLALLVEAVQWTQNYSLDTIFGQGIDLHLLGLREAAVELGLSTPEIFKDSSYKELNIFRLSTSQVGTVSDYWVSYGAVVPDGYGACYNPQPDYVTFSVASFFSCVDTSSDMFANTLESSLLQMAELCSHKPEIDSLQQR